MTELPVLEIKNLRTYFYARSKQAFIRSVDGVNLQIAKGQTLGIVGESGSGKSVTAMSIMGLISARPGIITGAIKLQTDKGYLNLLQGLGNHVTVERRNGRIMQVVKDNRRWKKLSRRTMKQIIGRDVAMIFQDPRNSMNPFQSIGRQISETIRLNTAYKNRRQARERALYWLEQVRIDSPRLRYHNNPYGLSGGMCQRAMIAMAMAAEPELLIADEPTTGLDATIQSRIVELMGELKTELGLTIMLISHDIDVIRQLSDRVAVMYGGTIMEHGPVGTVLNRTKAAKHPYTAALLASIPDQKLIKAKGLLKVIKGDVLDTINVPKGCRFYPRCSMTNDMISARCRDREPVLKEVGNEHKVRCWLYDNPST